MIRALRIAATIVSAAADELRIRQRALHAEVRELRSRVAELEHRLAAAMQTIEREIAGASLEIEPLSPNEHREARDWQRFFEREARRYPDGAEAVMAAVLHKLLPQETP